MDPLSPRKRLDCRRLDLRSELYVVRVILENPSMYLGELCVENMHVFDIEISPSTVCRTRKKVCQVPLQQCQGMVHMQICTYRNCVILRTLRTYGLIHRNFERSRNQLYRQLNHAFSKKAISQASSLYTIAFLSIDINVSPRFHHRCLFQLSLPTF